MINFEHLIMFFDFYIFRQKHKKLRIPFRPSGLVCTKWSCGREQALTTRLLCTYSDTFVSPKGYAVINRKNIIAVFWGDEVRLLEDGVLLSEK